MNKDLNVELRHTKERARSRHKELCAFFSAATMIILFISMFGCAYLLAEPWNQTFYDEVGGEYYYGDEMILAVGETIAVKVPLGENEKIASIVANDPDVLQVSGTTIMAKGQYWTTMIVKTSEIEIPQRQTESYGRFRTWLRTLFGIKEQPVQTEPRELNIYEINVIIVGYEKQQGSDIRVIRGNKETDPTGLNDGEENILYSENGQIVKIHRSDEGAYTYEAIAAGNTAMHSLVGFWKPVSEEAYQAYLEMNPQTAAYIKSVREACADSGIQYPHEGLLFVIQRQVSYQITVAEPVKAPPSVPGNGGNGGSGGNSGSGGDAGNEGGGTQTVPKTLLEMVNAARASEGLKAMTWSPGLAEAAKIRVSEITEVMSHTRPNGEPYYTVNPQIMYGENLAGGIASAKNVFDAWMNSSGHRANIMNPRFRTIGYASLVIGEKYRYYWAMEFGL